MIKLDIEVPNEDLKKIYELTGSTFLIANRLEYSLKYLIWLLTELGFIDFDKEEASKIMEHQSKKTIGALIKTLKQYIKVSDDFYELLITGLETRNKFIHKYFMDNPELLVSESGRILMILDIKAMRKVLYNTVECLEKYVDPLMEVSIIIEAGKNIKD
jgi:hypothetical protein